MNCTHHLPLTFKIHPVEERPEIAPLLPIEITIEANGTVTSVYEGHEDVTYESFDKWADEHWATDNELAAWFG